MADVLARSSILGVVSLTLPYEDTTVLDAKEKSDKLSDEEIVTRALDVDITRLDVFVNGSMNASVVTPNAISSKESNQCATGLTVS